MIRFAPLFALCVATSVLADVPTKSDLAPLPEAASSLGATVCDGYLYIYGGHTGKTHTYSTADVSKKFHRLKLVADAKWEELPGGAHLQGMNLVTHKGKVIRVGGMEPHNAPGTKTDNHSVAEVVRFDPSTKKWEALPSLPEPRSSHDVVVVGDQLIVVGGWSTLGPKRTWPDSTLIMNLADQKPEWKSVKQPFKRRALTAAVLKGKVYVCGGLDAEGELHRVVNIYDPAKNEWTTGPEYPEPRGNGFSGAACVIGDKLYLTLADGTVNRLSEAGDKWEKIATLQHPRIVGRLVADDNGRLLAIGGASKTGNVSVIERIDPKSLTSQVPSWPGFRNAGDGIATAKNLPLKWSETENLAWSIDLPGYGQSNPVVWGEKVFVTAVEGDQREKGFLLGVDAKSGKELWRHAFEPTQKAKWSYTISRAAPTPCVDAKAVYAFFEGGDLIAFTHDGKPLWARSLVKDYGEIKGGHGLGGSPAQTDDALFLLVDDRGPSYLLAIEKSTGKTLWKTDRPAKGSWTTPIITKRSDRTEVVISCNGVVAGYDASTGKMLWDMEGFNGNTLPSPSLAGEFVLIGGGAGRMKAADGKMPVPSNCCVKVVEKDGKLTLEVVWRADKAVASYASPLAYEGHAYFVNQVGVMFCLDLKTGKEVYSERIDVASWASPIGAGGHVFFFGKDGRTTVIKAGSEFEKVATNRLWDSSKNPPAPGGREGSEYLDPIVYGVAATDGAFFIRTGSKLFRVGK